MINDLADNREGGILKDRQMLQTKEEKIKKIQGSGKSVFSLVFLKNKIQNIPVFLPTPNFWRLLIDFLILLTLIYRNFIISIKLSFFITQINESFDLISNPILFILLTIYFIELIINLNTGYYEDGDVVLDRKKIVKNHVLNWPFIANFIAHITYVIYINFNAGELNSDVGILIYLMEIFGFLKIFQKEGSYQRIERKVSEIETFSDWFPVVILVFKVICWAHTLAIIFHLIGFLE